jgi:uncharacterized membrane protein YGL010W
MSYPGKLTDMLTEYAAAHQNPFTTFAHVIGIPMTFGVRIPLTWVDTQANAINVNLAHEVQSHLEMRREQEA